MNKIKQTSPDKVNGKLVKYKKGDCLSIDCKNGKYLGVLVSGKFNRYYDFTLIEFYKEQKPKMNDFITGKFFGTRFGSWEDLTYAVDIKMIQCKYIDAIPEVEIVGSVELIPSLVKEGYSYSNSVEKLIPYYIQQLPIRIEKSKNAVKFPNLAFVSKHLIDMKAVVVK